MSPNNPFWDVLHEVDFGLLEEDGYELQVRRDDVVILAHLHCVSSIAKLFHILLKHDVPIPARQVILIPKPYSTIPSVADELGKLGVTIIRTPTHFVPGHYDEAASMHLKEGCKKAVHACFDITKKDKRARLILVDDGGMLTETWWRHFRSPEIDVVSVQQTASGVRREPDPSKLAKIDIARSAAKRKFEARIISEGVLRKVRDLDIIKRITRVGVVGVGPLGCALANRLVEMGKQVNLYDAERYYCQPIGSYPMQSLTKILRLSDLIFGCTGKNFLKSTVLANIKQSRHFVSCSSRDVEFLDLLRLGTVEKSEQADLFGRMEIRLGEQTHIVENGGFPINFDRKTEQESAPEIVLTRALVLAGIFQAMCVKLNQRRETELMLSPSIQRALVFKWLELNGRTVEKYLGLCDSAVDRLDWWRENSFGETPIDEKLQVRPELNEVESARRSFVLTHSGTGHRRFHFVNSR
jgi:hypothetical protein